MSAALIIELVVAEERRIAAEIARIERLIAAAKVVVGEFLASVRVDVNIDPALRLLNNTQRQVKYATAVALTRTAKRIQDLAEKEIDKVFDRPTKFIQKGFFTKPANPANLEAVIGIKDRQAKVLLPHIIGGGRDRKPFEERLAIDTSKAAGFWVPGQGIRLNASGNLTMGQITQIAAGLKRTGKYADVFVGVPVGHPGAPYGIWGRKTKGRGKKAVSGIVPLLMRISAPTYRQRFDFKGIAEKHAQRIFNEEFDRAFRQAMASAR
jgi:hypothetical protein